MAKVSCARRLSPTAAGRRLPPRAWQRAGHPGSCPQAVAGPNLPGSAYQHFDEALFDYYATSQLVIFQPGADKQVPVGRPAIFSSVVPSPDGNYLLVARLTRPYSYLHPAEAFPKVVEVWSLTGKVVHTLARAARIQPRAVPIEGVATGPPRYHWKPTERRPLSGPRLSTAAIRGESGVPRSSADLGCSPSGEAKELANPSVALPGSSGWKRATGGSSSATMIAA